MAKKQTQFNTGNIHFDIINKNTLRTLRKSIRKAKDEEWVEKQLNSKLLKGILNGDNINKIADSFLGVVGNSEASAIRNARTMFTEAENTGKLDSFKELEKQGVVQKKVWVATPDDRTRPTHIDLDGEEVDLDEEFSNGCMYPADGNGPAEEVWQCRCSMRTHVIGFTDYKDKNKIHYVKGDRGTTMHDEQMAKEKKRRGV